DGIENNMDNKVSTLGGDLEGAYSRGIKYDFIVRPGGNPADIQLRYEGATDLKLLNGALVATTPYGSITEEAPYSYEQASGKKVTSSYLLTDNELRFSTGAYEGVLVIDPALKWGTYYGGSGQDWFTSVATDTAANVYCTGITYSTTNIATAGAHQTSFGGNYDGMVVKFDSSGARIWATYYGGSDDDELTSIACDTFGNTYLGGSSYSTGLASTGAFQTNYGGGGDLILIKLNTSTGTRQWATYFSGSMSEYAHSVICDAQGNVYFAGVASSAGLATTGAFLTSQDQSIFGCFNSSGQRQWSSYYPGALLCIHYEPVSGALYLAGEVLPSATGVATTGAHQGSYGGGTFDGYIARFSTAGSRIWGTYYGGSGFDRIQGITSDVGGNVYIAGITTSTSSIASTGAFQSTRQGSNDGMLVKFNSAGQRLWGTYFGGNDLEYIFGITIDPRSNIYMLGRTTSSNGLATNNGYKTTISGTRDACMAIFGSDGQRQWATYYGGTGDELNNGGMGYSRGKVYMAANTGSTSGIATTGAFQTSFGGGGGATGDGFLLQWDVDTLVYLVQPYNDTLLCAGDSVYVPYGVTQNFRPGNSFTVQLSNSSGSFASPLTIGSTTANTPGVIGCYIPLTIAQGTGYRIRITASGPGDTTQANERNLKIHPYPANVLAGSNSPLCSGDTLKLNSGSTTTGVTYSWAGPGGFTSADDDTIIANTTVANTGDYYVTVNNNGCMVKDTVSVVVNQTPQNVTAGSNSPLCSGDTLQLTSMSSTSGVSYAWTGPNSYSTQNVSRPNAQTSDAGTYKVTVTLGSCSDTAVTTVVVNLSPSINIVPTTPTTLCAGDTAQFAAFPNNAGTNPQVQWTKNGVDIPGATGISLKTGNLANGDVIAAELTANTACPGIKESNKIAMTILPILTPTVSMTADNMPPWNGGLTVTFTATPTHGGANPEYQWKRNGVDVVGATGATWGVIVNALNANEDICVVLKSSYQCAEPDTALSNCITTAFTGVGDVVNDKKIKIYPNPVSQTLYIQGVEPGNAIELIDILGRSASKQLLTAQKTVDVRSLAPGVYVLRVNGVVAGRLVKE
ncbi:MAG TPA: SBBP repeat-containing protein, partial [Flavipsychrobacter sp.]